VGGGRRAGGRLARLTQWVHLRRQPGYRCDDCDDATRDERGCPLARSPGWDGACSPQTTCPVLDVPAWLPAVVQAHARARRWPGWPVWDLPVDVLELVEALDDELVRAENDDARASEKRATMLERAKSLSRGK